MKEEFVRSRITNQTAKFHDTLTRCSEKTFKFLDKCIVKLKQVQATVEVNQNILGSLLAFPIANEQVIERIPYHQYLKALQQVKDIGDKHKKSKLTYVLTEGVKLKDSKADDSVKSIKENTNSVIDLIAVICTMTNLPNTYEEFVWNFISTLSRGFKRLDTKKSKSHNYIMQVKTLSWFLSSWRMEKKQDSVDYDLIRGIMWQFLQKSWLLYAVQPCLSCKKMLHTASLNLVLQSRTNFLQIMRRRTWKWFFTATTQCKRTRHQKLCCVHFPEIPTFLSSLHLSWIPTVLILIVEKGNSKKDFCCIKS